MILKMTRYQDINPAEMNGIRMVDFQCCFWEKGIAAKAVGVKSDYRRSFSLNRKNMIECGGEYDR